MAESWFELDDASRIELLDVASDRSGRPAHLLEKDIWVVLALSAIYESQMSKKLTFKGGTSLSKVYKIIDRFSEDIDLTYDIRELVPDKLRDGNPIPESRSHGKTITKAVIERLPEKINNEVMPIIGDALKKMNLNATLEIAGDRHDTLLINYPALRSGTGYASPTIRLEFGARATGEPNQFFDVVCDMTPMFEGIIFPSAKPQVMAVERTFWEKATAAHVYCFQHDLGKERFSRHWYDLSKIAETKYFESVKNRELAHQVASHKSMFFLEKDINGAVIDYSEAANGNLQLVPTGEALSALKKDYLAMTEDGLLVSGSPSFEIVIEKCRDIENTINRFQ